MNHQLDNSDPGRLKETLVRMFHRSPHSRPTDSPISPIRSQLGFAQKTGIKLNIQLILVSSAPARNRTWI